MLCPLLYAHPCQHPPMSILVIGLLFLKLLLDPFRPEARCPCPDGMSSQVERPPDEPPTPRAQLEWGSRRVPDKAPTQPPSAQPLVPDKLPPPQGTAGVGQPSDRGQWGCPGRQRAQQPSALSDSRTLTALSASCITLSTLRAPVPQFPSLESRDSCLLSLGGCRSKHDGVRFSGLGGPEDLRSASGSPPRPLPLPRLLPEAPEEEEEAEGPLKEQDLKGAYIQLVQGMQEWQDGCVYQGEFGLDMKLGYGEFSWPTGEVMASPPSRPALARLSQEACDVSLWIRKEARQTSLCEQHPGRLLRSRPRFTWCPQASAWETVTPEDKFLI